MGQCQDCVFWERRRRSTKWRPCVLTRTRNDQDDHPESLATASGDDDGWDATYRTAALVTAPTFGCVQFKER